MALVFYKNHSAAYYPAAMSFVRNAQRDTDFWEAMCSFFSPWSCFKSKLVCGLHLKGKIETMKMGLPVFLLQLEQWTDLKRTPRCSPHFSNTLTVLGVASEMMNGTQGSPEFIAQGGICFPPLQCSFIKAVIILIESGFINLGKCVCVRK